MLINVFVRYRRRCVCEEEEIIAPHGEKRERRGVFVQTLKRDCVVFLWECVVV
jgi:hypothetical protein